MAWIEMRAVCGVGVSILLAAGVPGQGENSKADLPRGKALGEVRNKDGKAWVGVKVHLVSWPVPENLRVGSPDTVVTRTDERGRFRAQILEGRVYTVWAEGEVDEDGSLPVSNVAEKVIPQMPVLLKQRKEVAAGRTVQVSGMDKWGDYKPFNFRLVDVNGGRVLPLKVGDDGNCKLPPVIGTGATVEILATGPHGRILVAEAKVAKVVGDTTKPIKVPPPAKVGFAIWDINTEKPVEGARIYPQEADHTTLLGVTGKDGFAEVVIPEGNRRSWGRFFAVADGLAAAPCQHDVSKNAKFRKAHEGKKVDYHAHLGEGRKLKGRVLLRPDTPAAGVTLVVQGSAMHYTEKSSRNLSNWSRVFRTDSEGGFELGSLLKEYPPDLMLLLGPEHLAALPVPWRQGLSPVLFAPINLSEVMGKDGPTDIVLTDLCPVELVVRTPMGIPAVLAKVQLTSLNKRISNREGHPPMLTDRRGRLRLLLPADARLGLAIDTGEAYLLTCLETHAVAGNQDVARLDLQLPKPVAIRGRVVDSNDKGVEGVTLTARPQWAGRMFQLEAEVDEDNQAPFPGDRNGVRLTGFGQVPNSHGLFWALVGHRQVKTGKDGRFTLAMPRLGMQYQLYAYMTADGVHRRANAQVHVDPKEGAAEVELVLR